MTQPQTSAEGARGNGLRARLAALLGWLLLVRTEDPVRRIQNRALAILLLFMFPFTWLEFIALRELWSQIAIAAASIAIVIAFICNRRGSPIGTIILICTALIAIGVIAHPDSFTAPPDLPVVIDSALLIPIAIAAFFLGPRAAIPTIAGTIIILTISAWLRGTPTDHILNFLSFGVATIAVLGALLAAGAAMYLTALRRVHQLNEELDARVRERTADLHATLLKLEAAREEIERRTQARANETTAAVHDMRNQMMTLSAAVELLLFDAEDAGVRQATVERMRTVFENTMDAQRELLDALLEAALLEADALVLRRAPADLGRLAQTIAERLQPRYDRERCALHLAIAAELPPVLCDERRIMRVLQNLLENALIYTVAYRAADRHVQLTLQRESGEAVLRVIDNGPGIAPEQLKTIGERFRRVAGGADAPEGYGIGLNTSIGIVTLHGGTLQLTSAGLGQGATAEMRLPFAPPTP
jgi:signal transduction histidine kinase